MLSPKRFLICGAALLLLAGCLPAAGEDGRADVAVINGPTETRVDGLVEEFEGLLSERYAPLPFDFIRGRLVRFQETHREMHGPRAPLQAAFIARALGGELSLLVGAPRYEREVTTGEDRGGEWRRVEVAVQLEASIVEPENADVLGTFVSDVYRSAREESAEEPLVPPEEDPDLKVARARALEELVGPVAARLSALLLE